MNAEILKHHVNFHNNIIIIIVYYVILIYCKTFLFCKGVPVTCSDAITQGEIVVCVPPAAGLLCGTVS